MEIKQPALSAVEGSRTIAEVLLFSGFRLRSTTSDHGIVIIRGSKVIERSRDAVIFKAKTRLISDSHWYSG